MDLETGEPAKRNVGELLMLIVSEISEAMEGHRKNLQDDKLPRRKMLEVELADAVIRILDLSAGLGLDVGGAMIEKMAYNETREDHTREARLRANGKKY
jgi:NTP pyrophosphatase (non-canonical NTP hydrolase)